MARPLLMFKKLRDGFYIEVKNRGAKNGMKLRSENRESMEDNAKLYKINKEVMVLGELRAGKWLSLIHI
jgi:hypothetical protein